MNDRAVSLLEQYEVEVRGTRKGRDAILCDVDEGTLIFKEYGGNTDRLQIQDLLLRTIAGKGLVETERLIPTKEGTLFVKDGDGVTYVLKTFREGRECNVRDPEECVAAVRLLAKLHLCTQDGLEFEAKGDAATEGESCSPEDEATEGENPTPGERPTPGESPAPRYVLPPLISVADEYEKRNRELRRIRKYLIGRSQKTWFEISLLGCFDDFYEKALEASEGWKSYQNPKEEEETRAFCHGDYQYHNVLFDQRQWFLINFDRCVRDNPVRDLHLLMRKLLEKCNWSIPLGERLLKEYERIRPLSARSWIDLYYRLAYPEKFWKIANFYYNSGKSWIPEKNMEKLEKLMAREQEKKVFLETVFRI